VNVNENFNILKQFNCALVGQIKNLIHLVYFLLSPRKMQKNVFQTCDLQAVNMLSTSLGRRVSYSNISRNSDFLKIINNKKIRSIYQCWHGT
jgi:hypothetical protein